MRLLPLLFLVLALASARGQSDADAHADLLQGDFSILPGLKGVHPRLFCTVQEVKDAQARYTQDPAAFATFHAIFQADTTDPVPTVFNEGESGFKTSDRLARLAAAAVLTGDKTYIDALQKWVPLLQNFTPVVFTKMGDKNQDLVSGHTLHRLAFTYDILQGRADPALVAAVKHALMLQGAADYASFMAMKRFPYDQNHFTIPISGLLSAAAALADEEPEAKKWGIFASNTLRRSFTFLAPDGWYYEGFGYWDFTMPYLVSGAAALKSVTGEDLFTKPPLSNQALYVAHMTLPNPSFVFDFGDWGRRVQADGVSAQKGYDTPWHQLETHVPLISLFLIEHSHPDPLLENVLGMETAVSPAQQSANTFRQFWAHAGDKGSGRMQNGPLPYHYFPDMEVVHWRSDWENPDATAIAFKSGPPGGHNEGKMLLQNPDGELGLGHAHPDSGSFTIFAKGVFLANGDAAYVGDKETINTNSILVDGIGQAHGGKPWNTFSDRPYATYDQIHMENVWLGSRIAASTAVFPSAYRDELKIKKMNRQLVMVDGRFVVVRDSIASDLPHQYQWMLHGDQPLTSPVAGRFLMENGPGRLVVQHLRPIDSFKLDPTVVETEIYIPDHPRPQQRGYQVQVASPAGQKEFEFLAAMDIQSTQAAAADFVAKRGDNGAVTLQDKSGQCEVWTSGATGLDGSYAYILRDPKGAIVSAGLCGSSLSAKGLEIKLKSPGQVSISPGPDGRWKVEAAEGAPAPDVAITPPNSNAG